MADTEAESGNETAAETGGGKPTSRSSGGAGGREEAMVPSYRVREEADAKRAALARVADLEAKLQAEQEKTRRLPELEAQIATLKTEWETERGLWSLGFADEEGIEVARTLHARLPEEGRPSLVEWLTQAKAEPSKAPRALQPYLAAGADSAPSRSAPVPPRATGAAPAAAAGSAGSAPVYSPEQIREMRERAVKTGDWSEWNQAKPHILGALAHRR